MKKQNSLLGYLDWYFDNIQDRIVLVHRPTEQEPWSDRCLFLGDKYNQTKHYNHRSILCKEVVIEYDEKDTELNKKLAEDVCAKLREDNVAYTRWFSGNKSFHIHALFNFKDAHNIPLLKNVIMRHYGTFFIDGKKYLPDLRLASTNHLVRAEYGVHEKTEKKKSIVHSFGGPPKVSRVSDSIWERYVKAQEAVVKRKASISMAKFTELPGFKYIASSHNFREAEDGRERALFLMIHALKDQYKDRKDEFVSFLRDWYKYSGGYKMSENDIRNKVRYHWNKSYRLVNFLNSLLESIGKEDLIQK